MPAPLTTTMLALGAVITAFDPAIGGVFALLGFVHEAVITFAADV